MSNSLMVAINNFTISPEIYGLFVLAIFCIYMNRKINEVEALKTRWHEFLSKLISIKHFMWGVVTVFFWYDHFVWQYDGLGWGEYLLFTAGVAGITAYTQVALTKAGKQ